MLTALSGMYFSYIKVYEFTKNLGVVLKFLVTERVHEKY
jgi:hypothetical protein